MGAWMVSSEAGRSVLAWMVGTGLGRSVLLKLFWGLPGVSFEGSDEMRLIGKSVVITNFC